MKIRFLPEKIDQEEGKKAGLSETKATENLFLHREYKKQLLKDFQKAKKFVGDNPDAQLEFYLSLEKNYTDQKNKKLPVFVIGKPSGAWKQYLKDRIKFHRSTDALGIFKFDDSEQETTGIGKIELHIEKGKAKPRAIKKALDKWLMPSGLEVSFPGEVDLESEDTKNVKDDVLADVRRVELDTNDKVQALYLSLEKGTYGEDEKQLHTVKGKIHTYIDNWMSKYEALNEEQQKKSSVATKKAQYDYILDRLDTFGDKENEPEEFSMANIDVKFKVDLTVLPKVSVINKVRSTAYEKILKVAKALNATEDLERKRTLFKALMGMVHTWQEKHKASKDSNQKSKMTDFYEKYKVYLPEQEQTTLEETHKDVHESSSSFTGTKTLFKETAGNKISSQQAKEVRDANVDDRAKRLASILQRGRATNNDPTFGSTMKWLADNTYNELEAKYRLASKKIDSKDLESDLLGDIVQVFGSETLRGKFLVDKLYGKESPYARLAFQLGIMGDTWRGKVPLLDTTGEPDDVMEEIMNHYDIDKIDAILKATDEKTFEGAIKKELEKRHPHLLAELEAHRDRKALVDNPDTTQENRNKGNEKYLDSVITRLRKEGRFGKRLDRNKFINSVLAWAENSTPEDIEAMLKEDSAFMTKLDDMASTLSISGFDKGDLAYLKAKLKSKQEGIPQGRETNEVFNQLKALADKQSTKNDISKWAQNKDIGQQFKNILFDPSVKNPQRAIIAKFGAPNDLKDWDNLEKQLQENPNDQDALVARSDLFERCFRGVEGLLDRANVHHDIQQDIRETLFSNGAKGTAYQKLVKMAKGRQIVVSFGKEVFEIIEALDPKGAEFATIKSDTDLLKRLKMRSICNVLGKKSSSNAKQWERVVKLLGRDVEIPPEEENQITRKNFKRKHRVNRSKLVTKETQDKEQEDSKDQVNKPEYWAAKLSFEYGKGYYGRDSHKLLHTMYAAQKTGVDLKKITKELKSLDIEAYNYVMLGDKNACRAVQKAVNEATPLTAIEVLIDSRESVTFKRQVDSKEVSDLVDVMSPMDLLKEAFDFAGLKEAIESKKKLKVNLSKAKEEDKSKIEEEIKHLDTRIKNFDFSKEFMLGIDKVLPPQKAIQVKKDMRFKLGDALMEDGPNEVKKLILSLDKSLKESDLRLLGQDLKAISEIELSKQSETGIQWSSQSSSMLQRDLATSNFLTKGWDKNERIESLKGLLSERELEQEKTEVFESLNAARAELQAARERFEERKAMYDKRLASAVAALTSAIFFTLSMASGVGAAAGVIQLVWALSSTFMQTTINQAISMATSGDRSGGLREKAEDFLVDALADQAGAITGLVGANIAFALDVKALGTFSQGKTDNGKALLSSWENILKTPFLKTAKGSLTGIFSDIGSNFVKNMLDEKESMLKDPIGDFSKWGKGQIEKLPRAYFKSLIMTSATTGVSELANVLGWNSIKFLNPDSSSANKYTANDSNREFTSDDARLGFWGTDSDSFASWFNNWGMFDASPKFGGKTTAPKDGFLDVFAEAVEGLKSPKMLVALANAAVWGTMDGSPGIKQRLGGLVDKAIDQFTIYTGEDLDDETKQKMKEDMLKQYQDSINECTAEVITVFENKYDTTLEVDLEMLKKGEYEPHVVMDIWEKMNWIGDAKNLERNRLFFDKLAAVLGITKGEIRLLRREPACAAFRTIREFRNMYAQNHGEYARIFANKEFVEHYLEVRGTKGVHPKELAYELDMGGEKIETKKPLEDNLNGIYTEWTEVKKLKAEKVKLIFP